jgi:hypothetical protein
MNSRGAKLKDYNDSNGHSKEILWPFQTVEAAAGGFKWTNGSANLTNDGFSITTPLSC